MSSNSSTLCLISYGGATRERYHLKTVINVPQQNLHTNNNVQPTTMISSRVFSRVSRSGFKHFPGLLLSYQTEQTPVLSRNFHALHASSNKWIPGQVNLLHHLVHNTDIAQRFGFSSSASPQPADKESNQLGGDGTSSDVDSAKMGSDAKSSMEYADLSIDDLVKLVVELKELLKLKDKEIELMRDKVLHTYAEMENIMDRTRREAENTKKYAIENFAKSLLDVADNLERASSIARESFSKIDTSKDTSGAVPLLKSLLEGVEMTQKQLAEVFRKFEVEKFDPMNEPFDPHRHNAVFQIPDDSKPPGTVAAVLKPGYMLHDRVIRPADVGVTVALDNNKADQTSGA